MSDGIPSTPTETPTPAPEPAAPTDPNSLFASQLATITAEGGRQKFATVDQALDSIPHNQTHIAEQAARIKELEEQVAQSQGVSAVLEELKKSQQPPVEQPSTGIDATQLNALLDQRDNVASQTANATQVLDKLKTTYGDKAQEVYESKAASLGMTTGQLGDLARTSPQAALAFFTEVPRAVVNPTTSSVNTTLTPPAPVKDMSHMERFTGGTSGAVQSWRDAAAP